MADDETIRGLRAQLIGTCHESGFKAAGWSLPSILPVIIEAHFGKRQRWKEVLQEECVSLCTHIIDSQRWQTNYSFRLNASLLCILFTKQPIISILCAGKTQDKVGSSVMFLVKSSSLLSTPLLFFFWLRKTESLLLEKKKKLLLNFNAYAYFDYFLKLIILIRG